MDHPGFGLYFGSKIQYMSQIHLINDPKNDERINSKLYMIPNLRIIIPV